MNLQMETGLHWHCQVCSQVYDMLTEDGDEEWAVHCGKSMNLKPFYRILDRTGLTASNEGAK